jgi:hypothetical protein
MKSIHYYSGILIALFTGLHILNHLLILHSAERHIRFMTRARKIYRNRFIETLLLTAVLVQVITGITLVIEKWNKTENYFEVIQVMSGLYLSFFLLVHVSAVLTGRYKLKLDTNLYFGAGVMLHWPQKLFFIPYYSLAIVSFFFHIATVHKSKMEDWVSPSNAATQAIVIMIVGVFTMLAIITRMTALKMPSGKPASQENV